jgi:Ca2+-binding RTX toxin-like protein
MAIVVGTGDWDLTLTAMPKYNYGLDDDDVTGTDVTEFIYTGDGNDRIDAAGQNDRISAGAGDDTVAAGSGNDWVYVETGNDVYDGGPGTDLLDFTYLFQGKNGELAYNRVGVTFDLGSTAPQNLGPLGTDRFAHFENVAGSRGNDRISGSAGANNMSGGDGNDVVDGRGGNDVLYGWNGADVVIGGLGADAINLGEPMGPARDVVRYLALAESGPTAAARDVISAFVSGQDALDLSRLDADPVHPGNQAVKIVDAFTSAPGEVQLAYSGDDTLVQVDGDRDAAVDMAILVQGVHLAKADVIL